MAKFVKKIFRASSIGPLSNTSIVDKGFDEFTKKIFQAETVSPLSTPH